jgi:hypothetical protein
MTGATTVTTRWRRTIGWAIFSVGVSLLQLVATLVALIERNAPHGFSDVLSRGDLIIIAVVLAAGSVGDMVVRKTTGGFSMPEVAVMGFGVVLLVLGAILYALVSTAVSGDADLAVLVSLGTFGGSLAIGGSSIWVGGSGEDR